MSTGPAGTHEEGAQPAEAEVAAAVEAEGARAVPLGAQLAGLGRGRGRVSPGSVLALQRAVGNRTVAGALGGRSNTAARAAIQRITDTQLDARAVPSTTGNDADRIAEAARTHDIGTIKEITNFGAATEEQRVQFIRDLLNQTWVGPRDEYALEAIWNTFGVAGLPRMASEHSDLWTSCIDRGAELVDIDAAKQVRESFESDVKGLAHNFMNLNLEFANHEFQRLGLEQGTGPQSPTADLEAELALQGTQADMQRAQALLHEQDALRETVVGYDGVLNPSAGNAVVMVKFDPTNPRHPAFATNPYAQNPPPVKSWDETKRHWDEVTAALAGIAARSPTVFAAVASGRADVDALATQSPAQAKETARRVLTTLRTNINATIPKLDTGELDWRDLAPIHDQLKGGTRGASGVDWSTTFGKSVIGTVIGDHQSHEFWVQLGIGTAAAALFIVAEIATGGLATAALIGGLAIGTGQALVAWDNYDTLSTAAGSAATDETRLVSQGQADAAEVEAIINTVAVFLDIAAPVLREAGAARRAAQLVEAATEASAATALTRAAAAGGEALTGAEGKQLIERSVVELGVQETAQKSGKTVQQLIEIVGPDSRVIDRLKAAAGREAGTAVADTASTGAAATARTVATRGATAGEEAFLSGGALPDLVAGVPGAVQAGRLSRTTAESLIAEAIDQIGPGEVAKRAGWRDLSQALGAESVAGRRLMEWRNAIFDDLERYVREQLHGQVQRTGTVKNFTNDIDMSFTGAASAATKEQAAQYLAQRLGTADFDHVMMAGLFTDPRRMHLYDVLPAAIRERVAARTASHQEGLIWNRRLYDALHGGDNDMAEAIRAQMRDLNVAEFPYRPLGSADLTRLAERIDSLHANLDEAIAAGDVAAQERLAGEIGDAQALLNATEGGGYFSAGGVRRYVSERPGEAGFPRPPAAAGAAALPAEQLTAILDQLPKLDHAAEQLAERMAPEEVQAGIRGIGKYGSRLAEVTGESGVADSAWERIAQQAQRLKAAADQAGTASRIGAGEADDLIRDAGALFEELVEKSNAALAKVRPASGIASIPDAAGRIQRMTLLHIKLLRAMDAASGQLSLIARALRTGVKLSDLMSDAAAADSPDSPARGVGDFPTPTDAGGASPGGPGAGTGADDGNRSVPA